MSKDRTFDGSGQDEYLPDDEGFDSEDTAHKSFGKEIKIGLTIILSLMVVLGGVVILRMNSRRQIEPGPMLAGDSGPDKAKDHDRPQPMDGKKPHDKKVPSEPTVMAANLPPSKPGGEPGRWSFASDRDKPGTPGSSLAGRPGPPMPTAAGPQGGATQFGVRDPLHSHALHQPGPGAQGATGLAGALPPGKMPPPPTPRDEPNARDLIDNPLRGQLGGTSPPPRLVESDPLLNRYAANANSAGATMPPPGSIPRFGYGNAGDGPGSPRPAGMLPDAPRRHAGHGRREDGTYKVQPNDSYWVISEKLYGTGAYFKALAELNRDRDGREDRLQVGTIVLAPSAEELTKKYPDLCPKPGRHRPSAGRMMTASTQVQHGNRRVYVVEEGDTLYDIARYELGKAARWSEIWELNREKIGDDCDYLAPGTALVLPDGEPANTLTNRPGPGYRR